ncbi:MAG: PaaI family thioesterase [Oscillospiraceae bacterium]|nr:PaaI family thioesterase [Oscillospiraceae bacterium]
MQKFKDISTELRLRLTQLHTAAPGSIGDVLQLELVDFDADAGVYDLRCKTMDWMRNIAGTLHGGMCATLVDQAMGCVAYCAKPGEGAAPTIEMSVSYHRPLIPGEDVLIRVQLVSVSRSLMHLRSAAYLISQPDKLCISASGVYFYKSAEEN